MDNKGFVNGNEKKMCSQLNSAIINEDLRKIRCRGRPCYKIFSYNMQSRNMIISDNDVTLDVAFEAIIRSNKDDLLKEFISEYGEVNNQEHDTELVISSCIIYQETLESLLLKAANIGSPESVCIILTELEGFDIYAKLTKVTNNQGNTALHEAAISASKYFEDNIDLLISKEPQLLEKENKDLRTPLHLAAHGNYYDLLF